MIDLSGVRSSCETLANELVLQPLGLERAPLRLLDQRLELLVLGLELRAHVLELALELALAGRKQVLARGRHSSPVIGRPRG